MELEKEIPLPKNDNAPLSAVSALAGEVISPLKRLQQMDDEDWEEFTCELATYWKTQYLRVNRVGGAGDMGRDVIAYTPDSQWENFQCKYYGSPLNLTDILLEIGKLCYHSYQGHFSMPVKYYFVAKSGLNGVSLNALKDSQKLKNELISGWDKKCKDKITSTKSVSLSGDFLRFIDEKVDFTIFDQIPQLKLIELHKNFTPYYIRRFGALEFDRPAAATPPPKIQINELKYIAELLRAIESVEAQVSSVDDLDVFPEFLMELKSARKNFYSAESLEKFSRDSMPPDTYENLLENCYEAISSLVLMVHNNGWDKYLAISNHVTQVSFTSHPLDLYMSIRDRKGACHQLVNKGALKWNR
ncbi:ABC-three component system protein [Psychrosphaera aquimarina]|uniref:ABC-three component system protein n=1 Tax=Psychrosphaera aquimarina TaxID=2044854 RepID=A0ABU3R2W9_9GAMM|nr:ABC-three component system protein [Psychrosphaera aquimarina]MDU0114015.1 ABC-three component system protein [Psychrosphaera aquimarina]